MAFQPRPLQIPGLTTNYSAENSAFSNLGQTLGNLPGEFRKEQLNAQKQQLLGSLASGNADYNKVGLGLVALGDTQGGASLLALGQKQQQLGAQKGIADIFSGGAASPAAAPVTLGSPNEVENRFVGTIQKAGLTNPVGLGAVAAYGKSESGYSPGNVNKTWSDPSESGAAGTSGGIMSWRAERLQNLQRFAAERGEQGNGSPETQAAFLAKEDPTLIPRLNSATTPQEANKIMADAWRFAGYNRPGEGEFARREGLTAQYAQRFGGQPQAAPAQQPVQVAENEADVQRLEQQQAARSAPPAQVAQSPDLPPQGANATPTQAQGFAVPGNLLPPNDPFPRVTTQQLYGVLQNPMASDGQRAMAKSIIDARQKYTDENAPDKREMTRLQTEKLRREVEGEGARPMTPKERADYNVAPNQPAFITRTGDPKFGPVGTSITNSVDTKGETEEAKAIGQSAGKRAGEMMASAASGTKQLQRIGQLEALLKNVESGRLQPGRMSMAALGKSLGVNEDFLRGIGLDPAKVGDAQAINAITGRMVVDMIGSGGFPANNFSDADRAFITGTVPSLANDPRGNKIVMEAARRTAQIDIEKAKAWRDWRKDNKGGSFDDFEVQWGDKLASQDRFSDLAKQAEVITGPQPAASTGWQDLGGGIRIREKR